MTARKRHYYFGYGRYIGARLFGSFDTTGTMIQLLATLAFIASIILGWINALPDVDLVQKFAVWTPRLYAAYLGFLIVWHVPARLWRDSQPPEFGLEFPRVFADADGARWVVRVVVLNTGPTGTFEAEIVKVAGGEPSPTKHIPLGWAPRDDDLQILDSYGRPRSLVLGFVHTLKGTTETPPGGEPRRPDYAFDFKPYPGGMGMKNIRVQEGELVLHLVVRDYQTRGEAEVTVAISVSDDDERVEVRRLG